ncbi:MAG: NADPH:quinone reductase [Xenococcaceae cyanobacterium MO_188.B32]|nr:NADPH:quinone reductase [Xenococcaceae cyanobacterium MO_188.B32]
MTTKKMMRAAWYEKNGAAKDVLQVGEMEIPEVGAGEVRVKVYANGVNPVDMKRRAGHWHFGPMQFPRIIPHDDGAGIIDAVGEGVSPSRVGERVWVYNAQIGRAFGAGAEYVVVPNIQAVKLPKNTDFATGASLGIPAFTAHRSVFIDGSVKDKVVFIAGGAGGVGQCAIQLAKWGGATVITSVGRPEQAEFVRSLGADYVLNYKTDDLVARIEEITGGEGVDHIVEVAFGSNVELDTAIIKPNCAIATFASDRVAEPTVPIIPLIRKAATIHFVLVYNLPEAAWQAAIDDITTCLEAEALHPPIAKRFSLNEVVAAHEAVESGKILGKVIVDIHL